MNQSLGQPLVSVIIPTYKRASIIPRTIQSVLDQTYKNLEILIVDDASPDNTEDVVQSLGDSRIRYIRHSTNQGASIARNTGVEAAIGDYVAFLDSDDLWLTDKIELQLPSLQNHPHPEQVVGYTQITNVRTDQVFVMPLRAKQENESVADYLFANGGLMQTGTLMMPRALLADTPFRPGIVPHEDPDLCIRLEAKGAFFEFIDQPLTIWHNDRQDNRATSMSDYQVSLNWIREYESVISPRATKGFLVTEVVGRLIASEQKRIYAETLLMDAALHQVISPKDFAILSARVMIPKRIRQRLKGIWDKVFSAGGVEKAV